MTDEFNPKRKSLTELLKTTDDREIHDWINEATDEELDKYISLTSHRPPWHNIGLAERQKRHFKRLIKAAEPHWTLLPSYRLLQISVGLATLAIIITVLAWWFPREPQKEIPSLQPAPVDQSTSLYTATLQTNAPPQLPEAPTAKQTSSPAIYATPDDEK
jgi:hypothetical protein